MADAGGMAATHSSDAVVARTQLLDIAAAALGETAAAPPAVRRDGNPTAPRAFGDLLVRTCRRCGGPVVRSAARPGRAVVVKVEARPADGTRRGEPRSSTG
ncbi:hypothetical protein I553_2759 [Mycobacterium xenopi 4042]|uniref:Uncharacterized protein n=1 Tax=Mycobacterium xenopi 4042 TaxID=1299334 RepID=X8AJG0_MYCXE|nr:hypothetical protein I553_2759 [Mycobacterium xenopi 4042]